MAELPNELQKQYALRFSEAAAYRQLIWKTLIGHYFQDKVGHDKVILDLGSGWGEFINTVQAKQKFAMDLNPESGERVSQDVTFIQQDCSLEWALPDNSLDVVFTSNFFEHLPSKECLLKTLRQAHRCLKPGGMILCMGPNIKYVPGSYWDFFDHYLPLTELSLAEGMRLANLQVEEAIPKFLPYTMVGRKQSSMLTIKLYLKLPYFWKFFGKQFLVTATKAKSGIEN